MGLKKEVRQKIMNEILRSIKYSPKDMFKTITNRHDISRQTINNYLLKLVKEKMITKTGVGRNVQYILNSKTLLFKFDIKDLKDEHDVWNNVITPVLPELSKDVSNICSYGFTEILNNVIDHSCANGVMIKLIIDPIQVMFHIMDNGVGIFNKIKKDFDLQSPKQSILELAKGKLTSRYKGVYLDKQHGKYRARIARTHIGLYLTEEEAARAYDRAALAEYGEFARLNFPM